MASKVADTGVEPTASAEQASAQPQELIDSVPGVTGEAAPAAPAEQGNDSMTYHGGYTGKRLAADGSNPNFPVVGDPNKLDMLTAAGQQVHGQSEAPKE